jgi:hypothetical protein
VQPALAAATRCATKREAKLEEARAELDAAEKALDR